MRAGTPVFWVGWDGGEVGWRRERVGWDGGGLGLGALDRGAWPAPPCRFLQSWKEGAPCLVNDVLEVWLPYLTDAASRRAIMQGGGAHGAPSPRQYAAHTWQPDL